MFILSEKLRNRLRLLIDEENLSGESCLFKSNRDRKYSARTVQQILRKAAKRSGIKRPVHPHTLRHSFATHLIENGYDVASVQSLLGHKSPETTMIYVHMTSPSMIRIRSPLDSM